MDDSEKLQALIRSEIKREVTRFGGKPGMEDEIIAQRQPDWDPRLEQVVCQGLFTRVPLAEYLADERAVRPARFETERVTASSDVTTPMRTILATDQGQINRHLKEIARGTIVVVDPADNSKSRALRPNEILESNTAEVNRNLAAIAAGRKVVVSEQDLREGRG